MKSFISWIAGATAIIIVAMILSMGLEKLRIAQKLKNAAIQAERDAREYSLQRDCIANGGKMFVIGDTYKYIFCEASDGTIAKLHRM